MDRLKITPGNVKHKNGKKYLIGYVGVIGEQEGLDLLLKSVEYINQLRDDFHCAIVGGGTDLEKIKELCTSMNLQDCVTFYGRVSDELLIEVLNTCDVCVNPDKPTVMNNLSTMNKIMEYMALKKPIVQYDLKEGKASALKASLYAEPNDIKDFAHKITYLFDNEDVAEEMGAFGHSRVLNELSWDFESKKLIQFYENLFGSHESK